MRLLLCSVAVASLFLAGCGCDSYGKLVDQGKKKLDELDKFRDLSPEYNTFKGTPFAFRLPKLFTVEIKADNKKVNHYCWIGFPFKPGSKDPHQLLRDLQAMSDSSSDAVRGIPMAQLYKVMPQELASTTLDAGLQGTFLAEYLLTPEEKDDKKSEDNSNQPANAELCMLSVWVFDGAKGAAAEKEFLSRLATAATDKKISWERAEIKPAPGNVSGPSAVNFVKAKVKGIFMQGTSDARNNDGANRIQGKPREGNIYLWKADFEKHRVFFAWRWSEKLREHDEGLSEDAVEVLGNSMVATLSFVEDQADNQDSKKETKGKAAK